MEFLWSRQEKLEGTDNKGGATISSCVEQLIGGISDILSLENILEATASILEDDEDENELEDELLLQCGSGKACGVDKEGDECPFDTQTKEELSSNVQPAISDSTEPVSGHNPTEILTDNETAEDNHVTVQNNQDLKPSDNTPVHQPSLISQECQEPSKESYAQTPSPDAINGTLSENTEKCDHSLVFDSNKGTAHREEEHARELVSNEREVSTTSSDINTVQSEQAANSHADTLDQTIDLPQENILIEATSPQIETRVQEEMVDQSVGLSMLEAEPEEVSATMSPTPGGEDMQESDAGNPGSFPLTADPVSNTEPEGESDKAGDSNLSPVPKMMETIVEEDNVSSKSVLDTVPQISPSEPDPEHAYTDAKLNQISSSELDPEHTDTDAQLNPDTDTEPKPSSSPIGPLSSTLAHSQDQQGALVSDEPEGGQTAPPNAPALEQGDGEDYRRAPIDGEQQLPVTFTDPDTHSLTEPPEQEPVVTAAAAKLQDQESGDQPPAPEPAPLVPAPEPASQLLPPDSLHAKPENLPLGLTAQGTVTATVTLFLSTQLSC